MAGASPVRCTTLSWLNSALNQLRCTPRLSSWGQEKGWGRERRVKQVMRRDKEKQDMPASIRTISNGFINKLGAEQKRVGAYV